MFLLLPLRRFCGGWRVIAFTLAALCAHSVGFSAVQLPPPSNWKGVNYSPRRHSYPYMLYDYYCTDLGQTGDPGDNIPVYRMVENDLTTLRPPSRP